MMKISNEDRDLIEKYILLPLASKALEADRAVIENSGLKFREQYLAMIDHANIAMQEQMRDVRRSCIARGIKPIKKDDLHYEIIIGRYHHETSFFPAIAKEKIDRILNKFWNLPI